MTNPLIPDVKYATLVTEGDGTKTEWEFNFAGGYISKDHVKAFTEDKVSGQLVIRSLEFVGPNTVRITPAVANGLRLVIYRDTPKTEPIVNYTDGSVMSETNLDKSNQQAVFIAAELADRVVADYDFSNALLYAVTVADEAKVAAAAATATANGIDAKATAAVVTANLAVDTVDAAVADTKKLTQIGDCVFIFDGESTNSPTASGKGWVEQVINLSNFKGRGPHHYVAVPGRSMLGTADAYIANVRPIVQAAVAAGKRVFIFLQSGLNDYGLRPATEWFVPFDRYVQYTRDDGATLVPMLCTRRVDWRQFDGVRSSINGHILELANPLTIPTDLVFTDPSFIQEPGIQMQSDDGIHPNDYMHGKIAQLVNEVMTVGGYTNQVFHQRVTRPLAAACLPYTDDLGFLSTSQTMKFDLSTDAYKTFALNIGNSFPQAWKTALRLSTPGNFKSWEIGCYGDTAPLPTDQELANSLVFNDLFSNNPVLALSIYNQASTMYGQWNVRRGRGLQKEPVSTQTVYPATLTDPGYPGQWAYKPDKTRVAYYTGSGTAGSHSWISVAATATL